MKTLLMVIVMAVVPFSFAHARKGGVCAVKKTEKGLKVRCIREHAKRKKFTPLQIEGENIACHRGKDARCEQALAEVEKAAISRASLAREESAPRIIASAPKEAVLENEEKEAAIRAEFEAAEKVGAERQPILSSNDKEDEKERCSKTVN